MPLSPSVIKQAGPEAAVRSWQPETLETAPGSAHPGQFSGPQPPFFPGDLPASEEEVRLWDGGQPGVKSGISSGPVFEAAEPGRSMTPQGWQPLDFKRLEAAANPAASPPLPQLEWAPGTRPAGRQAYQAWQPAELDLSTRPDLRLEDQAGLAVKLLGEVQSALQTAQAQAAEILRAAEARAAEMLAAAEAQGAEIILRAEGQANAMTRQGYSDGMAAANAEMAELLRTTSSIVEEVHSWREEMYAQGEMMMLRLVIEIAQTIFGDGLPLDPETLGGAFTRALAQAKTLGDLRIYVHPEDAAALGPYWAQQQSVICGQRIELIPSEILKRGGCFIEGQYGAVDARVESQFKLVQDTLLAAQTAAQELPAEGLP